MTKEFNSLNEIKKYYNKETNTYIFKENGMYIDLIIFNFDLEVLSNIDAVNINAYDIVAFDINANNINAYDIKAFDIKACNIDARDISYNAVCFAYNNIKCHSIKGRRENHKHFALDGKIEVSENE